ncbi:hypothetical protein B0A64_13485 [Flavobacterium araucananum]|uniref:Uncharacterized protein n=1 Tax=Flavobacterium araucananum TaxID=946678 RepID=A0A227P726_9FLAO|nr:hypothetical protein B0A64_13485 [Flavobacterium araucananum]
MKNLFIYCRFNGYLLNKNNFYSKYKRKNMLINFSLTTANLNFKAKKRLNFNEKAEPEIENILTFKI